MGMRRIAVQNLKGGTAKTTTAINLAHALARRGLRVLLLDADPQGGVGSALGLVRPEATLVNLLVDDLVWQKCIVPTGRPNLDALLSDRELAVAEHSLYQLPRREEMLKIRLKQLHGYDFVIVDTGPTLSLLHQNVLLYADELIIPIQTEYLALLGAKQILESMKFLRSFDHQVPTLLGVLPTFHDQRTNISIEVLDAIEKTYQPICTVLPPIPVDTKLKQAQAKKKTIFEHAPTARAAAAYERLAACVMGEEQTVEEFDNKEAAHA